MLTDFSSEVFGVTVPFLQHNLPLWQRLIIKLKGYVFLEYAKPTGYSGAVPVYLVKCKYGHGFFIDMPHGHHNAFYCRDCMEITQ